MSLSLVRVDDRLIHGQVLLMWTKVRLGDAIILLVDDKLANDQFLKTVFINAGNGLGKKVNVIKLRNGIFEGNTKNVLPFFCRKFEFFC